MVVSVSISQRLRTYMDSLCDWWINAMKDSKIIEITFLVKE